MESNTGYIMTLSNSIIGVSILAMPFCFKQCGVVLAILMLIISSIITRMTSHFLLKSAIMARRRTFELLAFHAFGTTGKFMVELGIIGFLMGTCIAFFVIIGDLGPAIIAKMVGTKSTDTLRTSILIGVALFCVLPLGLLKNVDSLHSVSTATIGFYFCLVLKTFSESATFFISGNWLDNVELWRPVGVLQCLPIFSMALSCQTQLFEIYETVSNPTLDKMNYIVRSAVNICVAVYICVGFFGYAAFASQPFTGNILMSFSQSPVTDAMKIGFVLSVAFSFPLVIFPCRASLHSLLFKKGYAPYEGSNNHIPESKFKLLTIIIVATSLLIGILIPNIEVVLGLLGSTIGTLICMIFPVTCFICISTKNTNERLVAQFLLFIGVIVMVMGTYANLYAMEKINDTVPIEKHVNFEIKNDKLHNIELDKIRPILNQVSVVEVKQESEKKLPIIINNKLEETRLEPPQPVEPQELPKKIVIIEDRKPNILIKSNPPEIIKKEDTDTKLSEVKDNEKNNKQQIELVELGTKKSDEVDIEAIKKEDTELQEEEKLKQKDVKEEKEKEVNLIKTIEQYKEEQKKLIKEQKELIEERIQTLEKLKEKQKNDFEAEEEVRRKAASQILEIAKKAIEQLSPEAKKTNDNKIENKINVNNAQNEVNKIIVPDKNDSKISAKLPSEVVESNNLLANNRLIPFPMAVNKTLQEIFYNKTELNGIANKNNIEKKVDKEIQSSTVKNIDYAMPKLMAKISVNDKTILSSTEIIKNTDRIREPVKLSETVNDIPKKSAEAFKNINDNPAKRDILSKIEITEQNVRVKREFRDKQEDGNSNEKCELTTENKIVKKESSYVKLIKEEIKSEFKADSNLINAVKTQLKSETLHLKRK